MKSAFPEIKISIVDDHKLFRSGLVNLINSLGLELQIISQSSNGKELLDFLETGIIPDIVILDIEMPILDGFETAKLLQQNYPSIKVLIITMYEDEINLIKILKCGIKGFIGKDVELEELEKALVSMIVHGHYYTDFVTGKLIEVVQGTTKTHNSIPKLKDTESRFLKLACSEYTYQEIADIMSVSVKTVDGYRANLFDLLGVKSRVGLVLHAIKYGIVEI